MTRKSSTVSIIVLALAAILYFAFDYRSKTGEMPSAPGEIISQPNVKTMGTSELKIETLRPGTGEGAKNGDTVSVHYVGTLADGRKFDSSRERGEPFSFKLGSGLVIQGWEKGILGMKTGETRRLTVPPELGYGARGAAGGSIPPNATLIFEVEMLKIN